MNREDFTDEELTTALKTADLKLRIAVEDNIGLAKRSIEDLKKRNANHEEEIKQLLNKVDELKMFIQLNDNLIRENEALIAVLQTLQINFTENRAMSTLFKEEN